MAMEPYSEHAAATYKLSVSDDWLRRRQDLALPVLPPTTPEARHYFFSKIREFASATGKINYDMFTQQWNQSANGVTRFYVTTEVLRAYAKTWEKMNNVKASKELISDKLEMIQKSREIFAASHSPFPTFLIGSSSSAQPSRGVIDLGESQSIPPSLSTELAISHPLIPSIPPSSSQATELAISHPLIAPIQQLPSSHSSDAISDTQDDEGIR